jgi:hypothetical protein
MARLGQSGSGGLVIHFALGSRFCDCRAANATHTATAAWNAWIVAIIIAVISIAALARAQRWEEWINLLAGIWLFISPWLLNYSGTRNALWDAVIIGAVVVILAAWI